MDLLSRAQIAIMASNAGSQEEGDHESERFASSTIATTTARRRTDLVQARTQIPTIAATASQQHASIQRLHSPDESRRFL
jgi:hypothetical protein